MTCIIHKYVYSILLFQDNFGGSLSKKSEAKLHADDGAHGLADRVEGVDFVQGFLWHFVPHRVVFLAQVKDKSQQGTFRLVPQLLRQSLSILVRL